MSGGELLKRASYFTMVGLVGFAVAVYGPHILGGTFAYAELQSGRARWDSNPRPSD